MEQETMRSTKVPFIKEWTTEQFKMMEQAIRSHFKSTKIRTSHGDHFFNYPKFSKLGEVFGLAYTSSGIWACYGICNTQVYFDYDNIFSYSYFTIGEDGLPYAILQDKHENELTIPL